MARTRTIHRDFFIHEGLAAISRDHRLLFIGLWTLADRAGRVMDRPSRIKALLFPYEQDLFPAQVDTMLADLANAGFIARYTAEDDNRYLEVVNFTKYQRPHPKEAPSTIPPRNPQQNHGRREKPGKGLAKPGKAGKSREKPAISRLGPSEPSEPSEPSGSFWEKKTTSPILQNHDSTGLEEKTPPPPFSAPRKKPRHRGVDGSAADGPAAPNGVGLCIATWEARFGKGSAPGGRIGKAVKPLLQHHPPERVAAALEIYLGQDKPPEFLSVEKFATTFADWDQRDTDPFAIASRLPHAWRCRSPDTCETDGFHRSKPHEIPTDRHCTTPRADPTEARCPTAIAK